MCDSEIGKIEVRNKKKVMNNIEGLTDVNNH